MDINNCIEELKKGNILSEKQYQSLCEKVKELFIEESNVQPVRAPATVCGDLHGQFYDLLEIFRIGGYPPETNYVFIGDFVDRGFNSVETLQMLLLLKLKYPSHMILLRGNHESRQISMAYGFYDEIVKKYGNSNCWNYSVDLFDYLPISCLINGEVLCVHGGLSPQIKTIDQIRMIDRVIEVPNEGPFCDLMWSDPEAIETWVVSSRGAGYLFGSQVVKEFNHINNLKLIARAHQLVNEGYKYWFDNQLATVWSAPNYCYRCKNDASILILDEFNNQRFEVFKDVHDTTPVLNMKNVIPYFL